jgi:hypothetical protein
MSVIFNDTNKKTISQIKSELTKSILGAPNSPDTVLNKYKVFFKDISSKSDLIPPVKLKAIN